VANGNTANQDRNDWQHWVERAQRHVDAWGNVLDPGIQTAVAALWAHGFSTRWSCEGHTDGRMPGPFVTIAFDQSQKTLPLEELQLRATWERDRLQGLLNALYSDLAPLRSWTMLTLIPDPYLSRGQRFQGCAYRLMSEAALPHPNTNPQERLELFRSEMTRFVTFLRSAL
jgi:hypothetical protein